MCTMAMTFHVYYRCVPANRDPQIPIFCRRFYQSEDRYFRGSILSGLQMALSRVTNTFQSSSNNLNPCVDLMEQYLCHYYFPLCNQTTGEIIPVCSSSCSLLRNNKDCSDLLEIANEEIERDNVSPPGDACIQTHRNFVNTPLISQNCISIEG